MFEICFTDFTRTSFPLLCSASNPDQADCHSTSSGIPCRPRPIWPALLWPITTATCRRVGAAPGQATLSGAGQAAERRTESRPHGQGRDSASRVEANRSHELHGNTGRRTEHRVCRDHICRRSQAGWSWAHLGLLSPNGHVWLCTHISRGASRGLTDGLKTASIHFKYRPILCQLCTLHFVCIQVSSQVDVCTVLSVQVQAKCTPDFCLAFVSRMRISNHCYSLHCIPLSFCTALHTVSYLVEGCCS